MRATTDTTRTSFRELLIAARVPLLCLALYCVGFGLSLQAHPRAIVDEGKHRALIRAIHDGRFSLGSLLELDMPMLPGYHAAMAAAVPLVDFSLWPLRGISFLHAVILLSVSALALPSGAPWPRRWLVLLLVPVLPVMSWLLYTDAAALAWVVCGLALWRRDHGWSAGAALAVACLMRQNNAVWIAAFAAIDLIEHARSEGGLRRAIQTRSRVVLPMVAPLIAAAGYLLWQGRLVMGSGARFAMRPSLNQTFMQAAYLFIFCAPAVVRDVPRQLRGLGERIGRQPLWIAAAVLLYFVYMMTVENPILSNRNLWLGPLVDLDDYVPVLICLNPLTRMAGFVVFCAVAGYIGGLLARARRPVLLWGIVVGAVVYYLPSWLISVRYILTPLTIFALAADGEGLIDRATRRWWGALSLLLAAGYLGRVFFW